MVFLETFRAMVACKNRRIFCLLLYATEKYNFIHINLYIFLSGTKQQYRWKIRLFSQASTTENISTLWNWTKLWKLESPISDMYPCVTSTSVCISLKAQQKGTRVIAHINFWHPKNYVQLQFWRFGERSGIIKPKLVWEPTILPKYTMEEIHFFQCTCQQNYSGHPVHLVLEYLVYSDSCLWWWNNKKHINTPLCYVHLPQKGTLGSRDCLLVWFSDNWHATQWPLGTCCTYIGNGSNLLRDGDDINLHRDIGLHVNCKHMYT